MATAEAKDAAALEGRITDEDIGRARDQIGVAINKKEEPWNTVISADAISHFAFGIGDDKPLFLDPAYGPNTRWHGQIAPPTFPISTGLDQTPKFTDPERKKLFRGLFRGTGKYYSGVKWTWYRPIYAARLVLTRATPSTCRSRRASLPAAVRSRRPTYRYLYVDIDGNPVATRDETYISADCHGSKKAGKYSHIDPREGMRTFRDRREPSFVGR